MKIEAREIIRINICELVEAILISKSLHPRRIIKRCFYNNRRVSGIIYLAFFIVSLKPARFIFVY